LQIPKELFNKVQANPDELRELLNVSKLNLEREESDRPADDVYSEEIRVTVEHADGHKCERCWHWETDVGAHPEHPTLCERCVEAVKQFG
jgi:isoleucyl-tRNA synthetase